MAKYKIISTHRVCGFDPGSIVEGDELVGADVEYLIRTGHVAPARAGKSSEPSGDAETKNEEQ